MPQISDIAKNKRKFKKREFRPYNLSGEDLDSLNLEIETPKTDQPTGGNQGTPGNDPGDNQGTPGDIQRTAGGQTKGQPENDSGNELGNQPGNEFSGKQIIYLISNLSGLQESIFLGAVRICYNNDDLITGPINSKRFAVEIGCSYESLKTSIKRLILKKLISRCPGKASRDGHINLRLTKEVKKVGVEVIAKRQFTSNFEPITTANYPATGNELGNQPGNTPRYSSSSYIKNTTTSILPGEWENIDCTPLEQISFTQNHLLQLHKTGEIDPLIIQDSIEHFAFDLSYNNKRQEIKTNPLSYFMGILKRVGVYTAPDNYESPKELAMRKYAEQKEKQEGARVALERKLLELEFTKWESQLSEEQRNRIIPIGVRKQKLDAPKTAALRTHFKNTIWPDKKQEITKDGIS